MAGKGKPGPKKGITGAHLFQKGKSGNPDGRPSFYMSKKEWMDKNVSEERRLELLNSAMEKALSGNAEMLQFLLARLLPPAPADDTVDVDLRYKTHAERGDEIFAALSDKRITPAQAHMLFATLCNNVKLVEMTEIVDRIAALEKVQVIK